MNLATGNYEINQIVDMMKGTGKDMIDTYNFKRLRWLMDRISEIENVIKCISDTDRELVVWSGSRYENYNMNRIKIRAGQLQQDIIKALEDEIELITAGITTDQYQNVASLSIWGGKRPTIAESTSYIAGLILSRLATLSDDEDNHKTTHSKAINLYGAKIAEKYAQRLYDELERSNADKKRMVNDDLFSASVDVSDISYRLGYYQALIDRTIYHIRD